MVELADTQVSRTCERKLMSVRLRPAALDFLEAVCYYYPVAGLVSAIPAAGEGGTSNFTGGITVAETWHPFHYTIAEAIRRVSSAEQLVCLGELIKATKIPANHEEIIAVWKRKRSELAFISDGGVLTSLLMRQEEARKKEDGNRTS